MLIWAAATKQTHSVSRQARQQQGPDISQLSPKLQQQWDHARNTHLGNVSIPNNSGQKVYWTCSDCPDGHPHQWEAGVLHRTKQPGCPFCLGDRVCQHNSVATKAPDVAASWDSTANQGTPHDFTAHSNFKKHWHCLVCGHKWQAIISSRTGGQKCGCPECFNLKRSGPKLRHPTLTECNHPLLEEWDKEANAKEGLFPDKLRLGSNKRVHWVCSKCPLGMMHKYVSTVNARALSGSGCSCCRGRTACKCNSLPSLYPEVAREWDFSKNDKTPWDYTAKSQAVVWWKSSDLRSWQQPISSRTDDRLKRHKTRVT